MYNLEIAGHRMAVVGPREEAMLKHMPGFPVFATDDTATEWVVRFGQEPDIAGSRLLYEFEFEGGLVACRFGRQGESYAFEMVPTNAQVPPLRMRYDGGDEVVADCAANATILRFGLWMALTLLGMRKLVMPIHSSVVVHEGRAALFLGESGTGKSTHTRLWLKYIDGTELLNDDSPILAVEAGRTVAYGSPWSGKGNVYRPMCCEVAAMTRLSQSKENRMTRLDVLGVVAALQPSLPPALAYDEVGTDCQMALIGNIVQGVPVYQLDCRPDEEAARLSCKTIFG